MQIAIPDIIAMYNAHAKAKMLRAWSDPGKKQYTEFIETHAKASDCLACRQCEGVCPQHLEIVKTLREAAEAFEKEDK